MSTDFLNARIARERSGDQVDEHPESKQNPNCFDRSTVWLSPAPALAESA
jgi:hypothetical protein